jgi:hypothetical protein
MNTKFLNNWAGCFSIAWMVGGFALIVFVLDPQAFRFEPLWLYGLVLILSWLGAPLLLAIQGLRRGNLTGRICSALAIVIFFFLVWLTVIPPFQPARGK